MNEQTRTDRDFLRMIETNAKRWFSYPTRHADQLFAAFCETADFVQTAAQFNWTLADDETLFESTIPMVWYAHFEPLSETERRASALVSHWLKLAAKPRSERRRDPVWEQANDLFATVYGIAFHVAAIRVARALVDAITRAWHTPGCYAGVYINFEKPIFQERAVDTVLAIADHQQSQDHVNLMAENICRKAKMVNLQSFKVRFSKHWDFQDVVDLTTDVAKGFVVARIGYFTLFLANGCVCWIAADDTIEVDGHKMSVDSFLARMAADSTGTWAPATSGALRAKGTGHAHGLRFVFSLEEGPWFRPQKKYRRRFSVQEVRCIRELHAQGLTPTQITDRLQEEWRVKLFRSSIVKICANESYKYNDNYSGSRNDNC